MRTPSVLALLAGLPLCAQEAVSPANSQGLIVVAPLAAPEFAQVAGRWSSPLAVRVTGRDGTPIEGARVSFRVLPEEASGRFGSGLATEIAVTGRDGVAEAGRVRWGGRPGLARLQVIAAKDGARTEILLPFEVVEATAQAAHSSRRRAIWAFAGSATFSALTTLALAGR